MGAILEIAREFNLRVLEDACEAVGAEYRGQPVGTFGDAAVFGFYPNKQMTTAEGGMIVTDDAQLASVCRSLRNQGRSEDSRWLSHTRLGFNYRLSDVHCALGLAQLERIDELLAARAAVAGQYARELAGIPGIALPAESPAIETQLVCVCDSAGGGISQIRARPADERIAGARNRVPGVLPSHSPAALFPRGRNGDGASITAHGMRRR